MATLPLIDFPSCDAIQPPSTSPLLDSLLREGDHRHTELAKCTYGPLVCVTYLRRVGTKHQRLSPMSWNNISSPHH